MKIEIEGILTVILSVLVILGSGGCYFPGSEPLPMPGPGPVPVPSRMTMSGDELQRSFALRVTTNVENRDPRFLVNYVLLRADEISPLPRDWRTLEAAPHPYDPNTHYEERFALWVQERMGVGPVAIGTARLYPPRAAIELYGYDPNQQFSWVVFIETRDRLWLLDLRQDLIFFWEEILDGSWVQIPK